MTPIQVDCERAREILFTAARQHDRIAEACAIADSARFCLETSDRHALDVAIDEIGALAQHRIDLEQTRINLEATIESLTPDAEAWEALEKIAELGEVDILRRRGAGWTVTIDIDHGVTGDVCTGDGPTLRAALADALAEVHGRAAHAAARFEAIAEACTPLEVPNAPSAEPSAVEQLANVHVIDAVPTLSKRGAEELAAAGGVVDATSDE